MADPPEDTGAVHETEMLPVVPPCPAETLCGAPGVVFDALGVTEADASDAAPVPTEFAAVTAKVYAVPFVSPVTSQVRNDVEQVRESGKLVTV